MNPNIYVYLITILGWRFIFVKFFRISPSDKFVRIRSLAHVNQAFLTLCIYCHFYALWKVTLSCGATYKLFTILYIDFEMFLRHYITCSCKIFYFILTLCASIAANEMRLYIPYPTYKYV